VCEVIADDSGTGTTDPALLTPRDKKERAQLSLQIIKSPEDVSICEGDPATFTVTAFPEAATYQWRKDGVDLSGENSSTLNHQPGAPRRCRLLRLRRELPQPLEDERRRRLTVNGVPVITTQPANQSAQVGRLRHLHGRGPRVTSAQHQWRKRQGVFGSVMVPIAGATQSTFTDRPRQRERLGLLRLRGEQCLRQQAHRRAVLTVSF
jgi:hypothetical protein